MNSRQSPYNTFIMGESASQPRLGKAIVVYDGECPFCIRSVAWLERLDWVGTLRYINARDDDALRRAGIAVERERLLEQMHVVVPGGNQVFRGFAALRWLAWRLPLLLPLAPLMHWPGFPPLGQQLYLWVARNRFQLLPCHGGLCRLPRSH